MMKAVVSVHLAELAQKKAVKLLEKNNWDEKLLRELVDTMGEASICGLGQAANPITCSLNYLKTDYNI